MPRYLIKNTGRNSRLLYAHRARAEEFKAGSSREIDLDDSTAIQIRRYQLRGDKLQIEPTDAAGEVCMEQATKPLPKRPQTFLPQPRPPKPFEDELIAPTDPVEQVVVNGHDQTSAMSNDAAEAEAAPTPAPPARQRVPVRARRRA